MRLPILSLGLLALLSPLTSAWSKEDQEIFRVRDEVATNEGHNVTFYDLLGIKSSASQDDISQAYRRKSKELHPDKVKQRLMAKSKAKAKDKKKPATKAASPSEVKAAIKAAGDRQARLGLVANILKGPGRVRYDHFMSNGFPVWKGTGYYYSRYRPSLGLVLFGVFLAGGGAFHYLALYMSWRRQREFVERYIKFARHAAWGDNLNIPGVDSVGAGASTAVPAADDESGPVMALNRKQRRMQERETKKETSKENKRSGRGRLVKPVSGSATPVPQTQASNSGPGPTGAKKRVVAENGKVLVVDSLGDVYLEQQDEEGNTGEFLLDANELSQPTIYDTALVKLPLWAYSATVGRFLVRKDTSPDSDEAGEEAAEPVVDELEDSDAPQRTPSTDSAEDFELLDTSKSMEDLTKKATGSQSQGSGKAKKRNKKR